MQLPNKLYSYKNSTLALIPVVLNKKWPSSCKRFIQEG